MLENYHHQHRKVNQLNVEYLSTDYEIRVKKFNDYAEAVKKEKQRIKEMEIEHKLLKELIQKNPVLDEMAKQLQLVYNFFNQLPDKPKTQIKKKKLTEDERMEQMMEEQNKKIEFAQLQNLLKQGKLNI
jgi:two-component sensor histidine kinase